MANLKFAIFSIIFIVGKCSASTYMSTASAQASTHNTPNHTDDVISESESRDAYNASASHDMGHAHPEHEPNPNDAGVPEGDSMNNQHGMSHDHVSANHTSSPHDHGSGSHDDASVVNGHGTHSEELMGHDDMEMHDMKTFFYFSFNSTILFYEWVIHSWETMAASCAGILTLAALYEGLKLLREKIFVKMDRHRSYGKTCCSPICGSLHMVQTVLHMVQAFISYCLMMVFMTFNVWLCVAVIAGAGVGHLIFGWRRRTPSGDSCH